MAFNITAIMNVALASGAATKISRDINKALQNKRVTVDLSLANPDSIKRIRADIEGAITSVESFGRQAGLAAKRFGAFSLAAGSMITLVSAIKSSTGEAISFDREMVRLGQVSNDSVASIQAVGNEVTRLSVALGVSSKDLIGAAVTLKQANLSIDDTKIALEALAKAALAPNFENFANTTQGAIAVLNQFKIGAAGLEAALGSVNAVAGEYAVEASDLVEVIRKTGGAFKSAGGDLNELLALFTSVRQTTRESAETISTGLRTIFTRIQRGQTIESLKELGINLRYTSQEAAALGNIKLADQFVGPYEAVRRLSEALAGIPTTSGKYSAIVEELGGYRQISKVIPLLQEFSVSQGALNVALGGSSSLAANAAQAQNAYIIKIQKIKEEFNALIRSVTQSSGFQKIFDTFISGASAAIQLADALKFLLPLITAIAAVKLATSFGQFVKGFATGVTASPNPKIFNQNRVAEGGYIKMAKGGVVPGSGSGDKVKALLEPGELVIPKKYAGGGKISVNDMTSLAIQRRLNDPTIPDSNYIEGKTLNKSDKFKYEIVNIKIDGGPDSIKPGDYKYEGEYFENIAALKLNAQQLSKDNATAPVDLEKNGFPYEVKNVSTPVSDAAIVDKLARYRLEKFGDNIFKNSSKGDETVDLGQIGLVYNTAKMDINKTAFKNTETITDGQENYRRKTYATQTSEGISNVTLSTQEAKNRLATKKASGGFMIPGTGNTDSFPMDLDEGSFVVRKSSVAKLGAENLHSMSRKGYAKGGKVPALLMPGEFVFSPSSAKSIGSANLERMNKHAKFAAGGRVGLAAGGNPIGEEAYTVASQTQVQVPKFQKIQEFVQGFPDLTAAQASLEAIILEEVKAFRANLSETQKLAEASRIAADVMRRYEDIDNAIKAQEAVIANRSSTATQPEIEADAAELRYLKKQRGALSKEVGLTNVGLPTGDIQSRTKIGTGSTIEVGKGKEYDYAINEKINISDEIRNRAREKAVKISPSGDGENIASVTKIRLAAEEESKLRKQLILAIGEQLRITTGITDQEVLSEMAVEKFTIAMQQNAKLAKDSEGKLLGLVSLEQDIVDSGIKVDQSMRGVSEELKVGSTAIGKLKLSIRSIDDALVSAGNEFVEEMRRGGGGIRGTYAALTNSRLGRIGTGIAGAGLAIGGQYIASTAGTAEDVDKGLVSANRNIYSSGVGEGINQAATTAIALSMIPVAGPFLAVIGGATAFLLGFGSAVKKAQLELLKLQVDKQAKSTSEKLVELKNFSGLEREQKGTAAFTDVRATVFNLRKTAASEGFSGAKLEEEVRAKSLEKFGSNLGAISEELSNAIANMVKPDDQRKSSDIFNEFKQTTYGQLAIESLGVASGKSATEVQKHALTLASSAITAKKLEEAQKNLVIVHEKITLRINTLSNSVNLAAESFRNISDSIGSFSDKLEGRSEFKIQQNTSRLKIGTDAELFNKEADKVFVPFGELGDSVKNQAKELNAFALELPSAFDAAKEKNRDNLGGNLANLTEQNLIEKLKPQGGKFTSTQKDLFDLFKNVLETKETDIKKGGVTGDKITKEALGQTIAEYEGLLQSNAQALNQVTQSYISGLRRISEEQKKYIQEFDKISDKSLSVNKANAAIQARAVRGNPEDFLTKEQRIAPFVERQQNITAGKMEVGGIQDPQTIFDNIKKAAEALEESDKELQASNADLASSNVDAREKARGIAEKNDNLRNVVSSLGDALRNLRDETVTLAEAESRLTKAEKDRENKLSVTENLLTMDRAGKRNLRRGKEAAEQVAGGANLEDMSLKQRKAFFEYTKLYGNIKLPELGGKTGEQVRQVALERASGGQGVPVGEENKKIDEALKDIKEITIKQKEAAELYARLIKTENASQIDKLKGVNNDFIKELKNLLITEFNRGVTGQISVDKIAQDNLKAIEKDPNFKNYTEIIGKGENKQNREKEFPKVFAQENLQNIADDNARLKNYKEFLPFLQRAEKKTNSRDALSTDLNEQKKGFAISFGGLATPVLDDPKNRGSVFAARRDVEEKIKALEMKIANASGPFSPEQVGQFQPAPSVAAGGFGIPGGLNGVQRGDELAGLLLVAEKLRNANTSIDKLPKAIDLLTKAIEDLQKRLKKPEEKANGGFIGRSMGGSIYNNPTKDIAQRDKYPTLLSKGEFVMNEGAARNNRAELEAMNKGHKVNYFAEGTQDTTSWYEKFQLEQKKMFEQDMQNPNTRSGQLEIIRKKEKLEKDSQKYGNVTIDRFKKTYIDPLTPNPLEKEMQGANNLLTNQRKKNLKIDYKDEQALGNATKLPSLKPFQDVKKKNADVTSPFSRMSEEESSQLESHLDLIIPNSYSGKLGDSSTDKERRKKDIDSYKAQLQSLYTVGQIKSFISSNKLLEKLKYVGLSKTPDKNTGNIISLTDKPTNWYSTPSIDETSYLNILEGLSSDKKSPIESKKPYSEGRPSIENDYLAKSYSFFNKNLIPRIENGGGGDLISDQKIRPEKNSPVSYILKEREEFLKAYNDYRFLQNNDSSNELRKLKDPVDDMGYYYQEITSINKTRREEWEKNVAGNTMPDGYPETIYPPITTRLSGPDAKKSNANAMGTYPKVFGQLEKQIAKIKNGRREVHADERIQYLKGQIQNLENQKDNPQAMELAEEKKRELSQLSRLSPADSFWTEDREGKKISNSDLLDEDSYIKDAYRVLINNRSKKFYDNIRIGSSPEEEVQELNKRTVLIRKAIQEIEKAKVEKEKKNLEESNKRESVKGKIELTGQDAVTAKREANLQARIKNGRRSNAALPYPVDSSGEFTKEGNELPVFRPTRARKEEFEKQDKEFMSEEAKKERAEKAKNRKDDAAKLKQALFDEAIRHTNPKDLEGEEALTYENVKAFGGEKNEAQKIIAFKKTQVESGDTDSIAQRLHTQIAKTIASSKGKSDTDPRIYEEYNHRFNIKDYKAEHIKEKASYSLKEYANFNMPVLNPAIMALREYYDSVDQRRFGFDQTEDFARTIKNKDIELAAKMDREAVMLIAKKVRGEVKVEDSSSEVSPIGDAPKKNIVSLLNAYNKYHASLSKNSMNFDMDSIEYDEEGIDFQKLSKYIPVDREEASKKYNEIYSGTMTTAKDLVNIYNKNDNLSYARPYYEKTKITQAELEKTIIDETNNNIKNLAVKDFLERQKKEKPAVEEEKAKNIAINNTEKIKNQSEQVINVPRNPAEAAKVIAEEQAKPVVAAPVEKAKPPVIPIPAEEAKPVALNFDPDTVIWPTKTGAFSGKKYLGDTPKGYNATSWWDISQRDIGMDFFGQYGNGTVTDKNGVENPGLMAAGKEKQVEDLKSIHQQIYNYQSKVSALADKSIKDAAKRVNAEEPDLNSAFEYVDTRTAFRKMVSNKIGYDIKLPDGWSRSGFPLGGKEALSIVPPKEFTHKPVRKQGNGGMGDFEWIPINASSGGPVAYRSVGGSIDTMLTPKEKVFSPRKVAQIESRSPGLLSHINSGGKVKHLSLGGQASFTVPDHAPNPKGIPSANTDTVYARLETGSFVVNAKSSIENASLLQHLASGGSVGYYADGGEIDPDKIQKLKTSLDPERMQKVQKALKKRKYQDPNEMQKLQTALPEMMTKKLSAVTDFQKRTETFSPEILKMFEAPEELQKVKSVAPKGYADGGVVGYYDIGGRVNAIANKLDAQKRKSEKQQGLNYDIFEKHMENKKQKMLNFNEKPKSLKDNKEIDKTYLTKMKHFEPNYTVGLDPKIAKNFMNQLNSKKIKGIAGPNADFNNADYFGEIGRAFNERHIFLRNQDVVAIHESLDDLTKGRIKLEAGSSDQIVPINEPLKQAMRLKKSSNAGLYSTLNAEKFMNEYGENNPKEVVGKAGNLLKYVEKKHTAITARAEYFNPNAGPEDDLDLRFKSKNPFQDEFEIKKLIGKPRRFEQGGHVNGASDGDTIPAFLSAGEFVMPRHAVNRIGLGNLENMRKPQRYYNGGEVGSSGGSVFDKMNNVANNQSANSIDVDSLNNAAREFNKAAKSFETSMAKMEKSVNKLEGTMDKLSKVNIPDNITGNITVNNQATVTIDSPNFAKDITTAVGKAVSDITGRLNDVTEGRIDIRDTRNA